MPQIGPLGEGKAGNSRVPSLVSHFTATERPLPRSAPRGIQKASSTSSGRGRGEAPGGARATNGVTVMEGMRALRGRTVGNLPSSLPPWRASIPTSSAASRMATSSSVASRFSARPPGNARCPDHGSPARTARLMNRISVASAAASVPCVPTCWTKEERDRRVDHTAFSGWHLLPFRRVKPGAYALKENFEW